MANRGVLSAGGRPENSISWGLSQMQVGNRRQEPASEARFQRFREEYLRMGIASRAALLAGYSSRMAHSKAYLLARRAWNRPSFRATHEALIRQRLAQAPCARGMKFVTEGLHLFQPPGSFRRRTHGRRCRAGAIRAPKMTQFR